MCQTLLIVFLPSLIVGTLWWIAPKVFLWLNDRYWMHWKARQTAAKNTLQLEQIPEIQSFEETHPILDSAGREHIDAIKSQNLFRVRASLAIALPLIATTVLALQLVYFADPSLVSLGLVLAEITALLIMTYVVWKTPNPVLEWVRSRTKAELLRREAFLAMAAVGPYMTSSDRKTTAQLRVQQIDALSRNDAIFAASSSTDNTSWQADIEQAAHSPPNDLLDRMATYLNRRIKSQRLVWMETSADRTYIEHHYLSCFLKTMVAIAILLATLHAIELWHNLPSASHSTHGNGILLFCALVAPPAGAALLSLQQMRASAPLHYSYKSTSYVLHAYEPALEDLIRNSQITSFDAIHLHRKFARIVLAIEYELMHELRVWQCINQRSELEMSP